MPGLVPPTSNEIASAVSTTKDLLEQSAQPLSALSPKPAVADYVPPRPSAGTGIHRYGAYKLISGSYTYYRRSDMFGPIVFLLFQEPPGGLDLSPNVLGSDKDRRRWSFTDFAKRNGLTLVGCNYFILRADD